MSLDVSVDLYCYTHVQRHRVKTGGRAARFANLQPG
jgi:hypothetical protein